MDRPGQGRVKLRDLARRVGVHPSTVSRVLSGDPAARLSQATRARILDAVRATGYRPNRLARSLKMQRTHILGMLIPDITNPFFSVLFRAVEDAAGASGNNVILCNTDDSPLRFEQHLRVLGEGHVDGLLIATAHRTDPGIAAAAARGMPFVLVNRRRDAIEDCWVVPDDRGGARLAVEHLASLGHRRIGHIAGDPDISTTAERLQGFREAMAEQRLDLDERHVVQGGLTEEAGARGMARLLELPPAERPTAVFVANDFSALGAMAAARAAGVLIPQELAVVGYNGSPSGAHWGLTTLRVPLVEMGRRATEILLQRIANQVRCQEEPAQITLPVELVIRSSTAPPRGSVEPPESFTGRESRSTRVRRPSSATRSTAR